MPEDDEDRHGFGPGGRANSSSGSGGSVSDETMTAPIKKLPVAAATLAKTWKENKRISKDDWQEWMRRLMIEVGSEPALFYLLDAIFCFDWKLND